MGQTKNWSNEKSHKKTNRTNIIATNLTSYIRIQHIVTETKKSKHKPTNVGIALERQASGKTFEPTGIRTTDLPLHNHMHYQLCYLALKFPTMEPSLY